jgi:MFS transporter, DHA2 family, multidrug resistance protein
LSEKISESEEKPSIGLVIGVMLVATIETLDITVVNIALPHIMGSFGATPDQVTWMITSYLIATVIVMPVTGYFVSRYGRQMTMYVGVIGFTITSLACGLSWSLESIVFFRFLQGAFGAVLVPISQSILLASFPRKKANQAMAIWGLAIMVAPVMGPVIGGHITEQWSWHWVFFINLPLGLLALFLVFDKNAPIYAAKKIDADWRGFLLLAIALASLQTVLDQGHMRDWFESKFIWVFSWLAASSFIFFVARAWGRSDNFVDVSLFSDRNFTFGCLLMAGYGMAMFSNIVMWPLLAQSVFNYPADQAGWIMAPRGLVSAIMMIAISTWLAPRVDTRWIMGIGLLLSALAAYSMGTLSLDAGRMSLIVPGLIMGLAMACVFSQLSTSTFANISPEKSADAAGIYNAVRGIGGSIGIAITSTFLVEREQIYWQYLGANVSELNSAAYQWVERSNLEITDPIAASRLGQEVFRHAEMLSFNDVFNLIGLIFLLLLPLLFFMNNTLTGGNWLSKIKP